MNKTVYGRSHKQQPTYSDIFMNLPLLIRPFAAVAMLGATGVATANVPFGCWAPGEGNPYTPHHQSQTLRPGMMKVDKLGNSLWDNTDGHDLREVQTRGVLPVLVLLVEFDDVHFSVSADPRQTIDDMLNLPGFSMHGASGSALDFYTTASFGLFTPRFDVYGPVRLSGNEVDYVKTEDTFIDPESGREVAVYPAGRMVEQAVTALDSEIDFSQYDTNGDGMVDFVYLFFPGKGATTGGNVNTTIWPHAYTLQSALGHTVELDGVTVNRYATSSELGSSGRLSGIGTFCHEFAHVLGLPDLYDTSNNGSTSKCFTPSSFSVMDAGNYNNSEHTPPMFSAYESYSLEWMRPVEITGGGDFTLLPMSSRPMAYKIASPANPQEYFIFECRACDGWDSYLEGEGLAVWHIDFDSRLWSENAPNNDPQHQRIDLIEADDQQTTSTRSGDLFPGSEGICEYVSNVSPTFLTWNNTTTGYEIENVQRHPDGSVSFRVIAADGSSMEGADIAAPESRLTAVGTSEATLTWEPVDGATEYFVAYWAAGSNPRLAAFTHVSAGESTSAVLNGLTPATAYSAVVYACSEVNTARQKKELNFETRSADFAEARTQLYPYADAGEMRLDWDAVEGADSYLLTVATRRTGETQQNLTYGFDDTDLPEGFDGEVDFETRSAYCGQEAPSVKLSGVSGHIQTSRFNRDIKEVSLWVRQRFGDATGRLDLYSVLPDGANVHVGSLTDFSSKGETRNVTLPDGVNCLRLVYTQLTTGLDLFIDDLQLTLCDAPADTPVSGYDHKAVTDTTSPLSGLDPQTEYVAYVVPVSGGTEGVRSHVLTFTPALAPSGIETPVSDTNSLGTLFSRHGDTVICSDASVAFDILTPDGRFIVRGAHSSATLPGNGIYIIHAAGHTLKMSR